MAVESDSILLVLPVPFRRDRGGNLLVEKQACNGLDRWADNFGRVVAACPLLSGAPVDSGGASIDYVGTDRLVSRNRIELVELPWAYKFGTFLRSYRRTRRLLAELIRRCEYRSFAIGGFTGDWASVAALEAIHQRKRFSIWTDRVEHQVVRQSHTDKRGLKKAYYFLRDNLVISPLMKSLERHLIKRCDLGLFHGRDCFDFYASYCRNAHLVHNIHLKPADRIGPQALQEKLDRIRSGAPLRLVYSGRVAGMKGPFDWLQVMSALRSQGLNFRASWFGDGPLLADMRAELKRRDLDSVVDFAGHVSDRPRLLESIRSSDLFVFCHKTPESPRCLIEALVSASPIVGYESPYSQDLLGDLASRLLVSKDDVPQLVNRIAHFDKHRESLAEMVRLCYEVGAHYSDEAVFRHRSDLIKNHTK